MSLWSRLFGSKPKTTEDEIRELLKAEGYTKELMNQYLKEAEGIGFSKEDLLLTLREKYAKK
jgi:DNA-binding transcriptional regulator YhcF (GntR family)